jgi:hypothetical protein
MRFQFFGSLKWKQDTISPTPSESLWFLEILARMNLIFSQTWDVTNCKTFWQITNFHRIFEKSKIEIAFFTGHLLQII